MDPFVFNFITMHILNIVFRRISRELSYVLYKIGRQRGIKALPLVAKAMHRENSRGPGQNFIRGPYDVIIFKQQD